MAGNKPKTAGPPSNRSKRPVVKKAIKKTANRARRQRGY